MQLYDLFTKEDLDAQIAAKMVKVTAHPILPLRILNYTQVATYTPELWNRVTDQCRGLIVDDRDQVVARPFQKFWNLNDPRHTETLLENLPDFPPTLTRKMDGSLGIGYPWCGRWHIATRGSFTSDQATWASDWFAVHPCAEGPWPRGWTPLFEIIYPENQIVVRYDYSGLVLLAMVHNRTGREMGRDQLEYYGRMNGLRVVEVFDKPLDVCASEDLPNEEGYVAQWDFNGPPLRVKIKYGTYCRLHKLMTQTSAMTVWQMLVDGLDVEELTKDVPAEFRGWVLGLQQRFRADYKKIVDTALCAMLDYPGEKIIGNAADKKDFALYAVAKPPVTHVLFAMVDGKKYEHIVWRMLKPTGEGRTFKAAEE